MSRNVTAKAHRPGPQARGRSALARMLARRPHLLSRTPATHSCHALLSRPTDHERCIGRSAVDICRVTTVHPAPTRVTRPRLSALRSQPQTSEPHSSLKPEGPSPAAPARPPARRAMRPDIQRLKRRSAPRQASSSRRIRHPGRPPCDFYKTKPNTNGAICCNGIRNAVQPVRREQ